jgi:hypothetical protein
VPIKLSPIKRNIHKGTKDNPKEKNNISDQTFLFSTLAIFLRNNDIEINIPINNPIKWNLYPYGESKLRTSNQVVGNNPTSKTKFT